MESQPQNPEFGIIPENFHPCSRRKMPSARHRFQDKKTLAG